VFWYHFVTFHASKLLVHTNIRHPIGRGKWVTFPVQLKLILSFQLESWDCKFAILLEKSDTAFWIVLWAVVRDSIFKKCWNRWFEFACLVLYPLICIVSKSGLTIVNGGGESLSSIRLIPSQWVHASPTLGRSVVLCLTHNARSSYKTCYDYIVFWYSVLG